MKRHRVLASMLIAGLLGVIAIKWSKAARPAGKSSDRQSSRSVSPSRAVSDERANAEERGRAPSSAANRGHTLTRHEAGQLNDFILPQLEGNDVTIGQALKILSEAYQDACFRSQEKPLALKFSVRDEPDLTISFSLSGKAFSACLDHLAALAGLTVERKELNFELLRSSTADQPADLSFQKYSLAMPQLRALAGQQPSSEENDWESLLRSAGFILEKGTTLTQANDGFLRIHGSTAEIARVESALKLATQPQVQLKLITQLLKASSPLEIPQPALTESELQQFLASAVQEHKAELTTCPSVTAREGQSATIEMIREVTKDGETDWRGHKIEFQAGRVGLKMAGHDRSEFRPEDADEAGWLADSDAVVYPGSSQIKLVGARDGAYHYRILGLTPIDATGRPLGAATEMTLQTPEDHVVFHDPDANVANQGQPQTGNSHPVANAVPGKAGFVFSPHNNKIVDVEGHASGSLVADPTVPAAEKKYFRVP